MPTISEVNQNAQLKKKIAAEAGLKPSQVSDKNLLGAQDMLHGAAAAGAQGQDPTKAAPEQLKAAAADTTDKPDTTSAADLTKQQKIAYAITAIAPTLLGYAFGGDTGGAIGAQQSQIALKNLDDQESAKSKAAKEAADKKELKQMEIDGRKEIADTNAAASSGQRAIANEMARDRLDMAKQKKAEQDEKVALSKTVQGRIDKLSKEKQDSLYKAKEGLQAVQGMADALIGNNDNTFSLIGDNDFTRNSSRFEEALGRMQSGGAITKDEIATFRKFRPVASDSADQQRKKLVELESMFQDRLKIMGFSPDELGLNGGHVATNYGTPAAQKGGGSQRVPMPFGPATANAAGEAPAKPDFSKMSVEELRKFNGKK